MNRDTRFKHFLDKANLKYENKFDYSLVDYTKQKAIVKIICPEHGEFFQSPDKHLSTKFGCSKCSFKLKDDKVIVNHKKSIYNQNYSLNKLTEKFQDKFEYDFTKFNNTYSGVIIVNCKLHGRFEKSLSNLMINNNIHGCNKCSKDNLIKSKTKSYDDFLINANLIYDNFYSYIKTNYVNRESIIDIICPIHGVFQKRAQKHLSGQGCIKCMYDNLIDSGQLPGGYCEKTFEENPSLKSIVSKLYYLSINDGKFYKIGITTTNIEDRIKSLKNKSKGYIKKCKIIYYSDGSLYDCFLKEQEILKYYSYARSPRKWSTEVFNEDISKDINFVSII